MNRKKSSETNWAVANCSFELSLVLAISGFIQSCSQQIQAVKSPSKVSNAPATTDAHDQKQIQNNSSRNPEAPTAQTNPKTQETFALTMPAEVFGKEGTQTVVSLNLTDAQALGKRLWLLTHNVRYKDKASVQINGGAWVNLNNTDARMEGTSQTFGGVGGSFATLKMSIPVAPNQLKKGTNSVTFKFNKSDGHTMGYRVVKLNILDADGKKLIPESDIADSTATSWLPPSTSPDDIAAGKTLWNSGQLVSSYLPGATPIRAHCSDCHTVSGYDLKYFGYSTKSIAERAKFHGMNDVQANQVASYIRSLPVNATGRPWNPPYQPGPGLTSKPAEAWAAGAGIENVLDDDWDTVRSLFPNGFNRAAVMDGDTNNVKRLTGHDTPLAFQLPDWNHWLPEIHPVDSFPDGNWEIRSDGTRFWTVGGASARNWWLTESHDRVRYNHTRYQLLNFKDPIKNWYFNSTNGGDSSWKAALQSGADFFQPGGPSSYYAFKDWGAEGLGFKPREMFQESSFSNPANKEDNIVSDISETKNDAQKVYSMRLLRLVKVFELQEEFRLTGVGPDITKNNNLSAGFDAKYALPRAWFGVERLIFDSSPFLSNLEESHGITGSNSGNNSLNYDYLSTAWYTLQLLLNGGQRFGTAHNVIDYGYAHGFLNGAARLTGNALAGRDVLWVVKGLDEADNGLLPGPEGWSFRRAGLKALESALGLFNTTVGDKNSFWFDTVNSDRKKLLQVLVQVSAEKQTDWLPEQYIMRNGTPFDPSEDGGNWENKYKIINPNNSTMALGVEQLYAGALKNIGNNDNKINCTVPPGGRVPASCPKNEYSPNSEDLARGVATSHWQTLSALKITQTVHPALVNGYSRFCAALWPGLDASGAAQNSWETLIQTSGIAPAAPSVSLSTPVTVKNTAKADTTKKTVRVVWEGNGSNSYNIKRSDSAAGPFLTAAYFRDSGSFIDTIPLPGRAYFYKISANSDAGESPDSSAVQIQVSP